jgi:hypothetical protein
MPLREEYRAKAQECLETAAAPTTDIVAATFLRMLAADYYALAEQAGPITQQQQQIQPKKDDG